VADDLDTNANDTDADDAVGTHPSLEAARRKPAAAIDFRDEDEQATVALPADSLAQLEPLARAPRPEPAPRDAARTSAAAFLIAPSSSARVPPPPVTSRVPPPSTRLPAPPSGLRLPPPSTRSSRPPAPPSGRLLPAIPAPPATPRGSQVPPSVPPPPVVVTEPPAPALLAPVVTAPVMATPLPAVSQPLPSIRPLAHSIPPPAPTSSRGAIVFAVAAVAAAAVFSIGMVAHSRGLAGFGFGKGSVVVTLGGPGGVAVPGAEVRVDGRPRCTESPCSVVDLDPGAHVVEVSAPGYVRAAARAFVVRAGEQGAMQIALEPMDAWAAPRAAQPAPQALPASAQPAEATPRAASAPEPAPSKPAEPAAAGHGARAPARAAAAREPAPRAAPAAAEPAPEQKQEKGLLQVSAGTSANVVVDGRPIGAAPRTVRLKPGTHTVVIAAADGRREVRSVTVSPGGTHSVGAF
jgi:hypothetical protein